MKFKPLLCCLFTVLVLLFSNCTSAEKEEKPPLTDKPEMVTTSLQDEFIHVVYFWLNKIIQTAKWIGQNLRVL